jgi:hypothetical protein
MRPSPILFVDFVFFAPSTFTVFAQVLFRNNFALSRDIASSFKVLLVTMYSISLDARAEFPILDQSS